MVQLPDTLFKITMLTMFIGEKKCWKLWKRIAKYEKWQRILKNKQNRNNMTEIYKTKIMSSINEYKSSVDMDEEIISEVEDKTEGKYIYIHITIYIWTTENKTYRKYRSED